MPQMWQADVRGCGQHIEQVLGDVPKSQRCHCREEARASGDEGGMSMFEALFGL